MNNNNNNNFYDYNQQQNQNNNYNNQGYNNGQAYNNQGNYAVFNSNENQYVGQNTRSINTSSNHIYNHTDKKDSDLDFSLGRLFENLNDLSGSLDNELNKPLDFNMNFDDKDPTPQIINYNYSTAPSTELAQIEPATSQGVIQVEETPNYGMIMDPSLAQNNLITLDNKKQWSKKKKIVVFSILSVLFIVGAAFFIFWLLEWFAVLDLVSWPGFY